MSSLLDISVDDVKETLDPLHSVLDIPPTRDSPIRLLHESFRDFLVESSVAQTGRFSAGEFHVDEAETQARLAAQCLHCLERPVVLKQDVCGVGLPGFRRTELGARQRTDCISPVVAYACSYWALHTLKSRQELFDGSQTHGFLQRHFLHWLEALSWLCRLSSAIAFITQLQSRVNVST